MSDPTSSTRIADPAVALTDVLAALTELLGSAPPTESFDDNLRVFIQPDRLIEALTLLRDGYGFALLSELGGVDYLGYPGRSSDRPRFEVHYVLRNLDANRKIVIKAGVDDPDPTLPSAFPVWMGADWMEREVFDMYGIRFEGHPDLRRILMPDEFVAFPLRKDYPLRGRGERHNFPRITRAQS